MNAMIEPPAIRPGDRVMIDGREGEVVTVAGPPDRLQLGIRLGDGEFLFTAAADVREAADRPVTVEVVDVEAGIAVSRAIAAGGETHGSVTLLIRTLAGTVLALSDQLAACRDGTGGAP